MIQVRKAQHRGHANHGWLNTWHTFSFSTYQDRDHMKFRSPRVMNEDTVAPGQGFGTHPRNDMEIVTYVLEGALEHKDSMGNGEVLRPGEFQRMSAGTGITHSEFNPSDSEPVHLYQIGHQLPEGRYGWLQVLRGSVSLNGVELDTSDGAAVSEETRLSIRANTDAEIMLFDLA